MKGQIRLLSLEPATSQRDRLPHKVGRGAACRSCDHFTTLARLISNSSVTEPLANKPTTRSLQIQRMSSSHSCCPSPGARSGAAQIGGSAALEFGAASSANVTLDAAATVKIV